MSTLAEAAGPPRQSLARRAPARLAPALFALTLFASALLLFAVQPMFTKMVLPRLGGAPAVWSVAMVFFQAALLLGYAYAHLLARTLRPGRAALVHLGVSGGRRHACRSASRTASTRRPRGLGSGWWRCLPLDRPAVRRALGERAAAAKLVRRERPSAGAQPLRALCGLQPRLVRGADRLSVRDRAAADAARAGLDVVGRLCGLGAADRRAALVAARGGRLAHAATASRPLRRRGTTGSPGRARRHSARAS